MFTRLTEPVELSCSDRLLYVYTGRTAIVITFVSDSLFLVVQTCSLEPMELSCSDGLLCVYTGRTAIAITFVSDVDECASSPCQNGGLCTQPEPATFNCTCLDGYFGDRCQQGE